MNWSGKKVLVTGAGGFIGSHLTERLVEYGAAVTAFIRYTSRGGKGLLRLLPEDKLDTIRIVQGDLRDPECVRKAVRGQEVVCHLGALIAIPYSYVNPTEVVDVNVMGTVNVLNAALNAECERVVHTSTSETYGTAVSEMITEDHPKQPQSPYSASKIGADAIAHSYFRSFDLPVATIRPFNTYGPRQSGRAVIPTIIGQALHKSRIELGALTPTRDLTYVTDTAAAFMAIAASNEAVGQETNIGNGREISIGELAQRILRRLGRDIPVVSCETRMRPQKSEVYRLICNASKATRIAGWEPIISLNEGLDRVIEFLKEHPSWTDVEGYEV